MRRLLLVIMLLTASTLLGQERQGPPQIRVIPLKPQKDSDFKFISVQLEIRTDRDGKQKTGYRTRYAPPMNGQIVWKMDDLNEKDGTYKAHKLSDEEAAPFIAFMNAQIAQVQTQAETQQLDEADIPPQHQHQPGPGGVWTTDGDNPIGGIDLAPPPDGCPCLGQECTGSVIAFEGTKNSITQTQYTRTTASGGWRRFVNNLQRCQFSSTGGNGYYWGSPGGIIEPRWYVTTPLPHQEGPHASGVIPSHWDMDATGDYRSDQFGLLPIPTNSEDKVSLNYDTGETPQMIVDGYHSDWGDDSWRINGYGGATTVSSCEQ